MKRKTSRYLQRVAKRLKIRRLSSRLNPIQTKQILTDQFSNIKKFHGQVQQFSRLLAQSNNSLFARLSSRQPLKLVGFQMPVFSIPPKVEVLIQGCSKGSPGEREIEMAEIEAEGNPVNLIWFQAFKKYKGELNLSIQQMKLNPSSVQLPDFLSEYFTITKAGSTSSSIQAINLWYYKQENISTWHYDGHDNFLFLLNGTKTIYLAPPNTVHHRTLTDPLYSKSKNLFHTNANHSQTKFFQDFAAREMYKAELRETECLFIPRGWWHYVESRGDPNIALNVWGNSLRTEVAACQEQAMLKHLIFTISERLSEEVAGWQDLPEEWRAKYRQSYFLSYFKRLLVGGE